MTWCRRTSSTRSYNYNLLSACGWAPSSASSSLNYPRPVTNPLSFSFYNNEKHHSALLPAHPQQTSSISLGAGNKGVNAQQVRTKYTKTNSYRVPARAHVFTRTYSQRPHIGIRALSAEYVETGRTVVKQRKYIAKNPNVTRYCTLFFLLLSCFFT